eukprot:5119639-Pyramimonas_sp.AAC.1
MYRAEGCIVPGRPEHVKTRASIKTFSAHPHARHPPGQSEHVQTSVSIETSSTHPHARHPSGRPGH